MLRRPAKSCLIGVAALGLLAVICAQPATAQQADLAAAWRPMFRRPEGAPPAPPDNPLAGAKITLGARLFSDVRLSGKADRSCASCHRLDQAFTDGRRRARAVSGAALRRN